MNEEGIKNVRLYKTQDSKVFATDEENVYLGYHMPAFAIVDATKSNENESINWSFNAPEEAFVKHVLSPGTKIALAERKEVDYTVMAMGYVGILEEVRIIPRSAYDEKRRRFNELVKELGKEPTLESYLDKYFFPPSTNRNW